MSNAFRYGSCAAMICAALLLQSCQALVWTGIICADVARCSDVEFESFEDVWVASAETRPGTLGHIAVAPFPGDPHASGWWAAVFGQATGRRMTGPDQLIGRLPEDLLAHLSDSRSEQEDIALAEQISRIMDADGVFFGSVESRPPKKAFWWWKDRYPRRLSLRLVSGGGEPLWRGVLPFSVIKGSKDIDEDLTKRVLLTHVVAHWKELRWSELGLTPADTGS